MSIKSSNKILLLIIGALLITNLVMLFLYVLKPKNQHFEGRFRGQDSGLVPVLRDKVGFDEQQIADYLELRSRQRQRTSETYSGMTEVKERFYFSIFDNQIPDSLINNIADSIANKQKKVDLGMRNYFIEIRGLCKTEQQPAFDSAFKRVIYRMIGMPGMGRQSQQNEKK
ncbi:MAG: hypothetical protein J5I50_08640 [Chitinophagaceae bacterium]|nr:hypothetical protein [Chitinophagaceae bacterium]